MYKLESALLRKIGSNQEFESVSIGAMTIAKIYEVYRDGHIQLSHKSLTRDVYLTLDRAKELGIGPTNLTFDNWLRINKDNTIEGTFTKPFMIEKNIRFSDAIQAGFSFEYAHPKDAHGQNTYPMFELSALLLTKRGVSGAMLDNRTLITVNGLLHHTTKRGNGRVVHGGGRTIQYGQDNHVGVISFEEHSPIEQYRINPKWMFADKNQFSKTIHLKTGKSFKGKSMLLSFMGVLLDDRYFTFTDEGSVTIDIAKIDVLQLYFDNRDRIDLSSLKLTEKLYLDDSAIASELVDTLVVEAILDLPQTFLIAIDCPVVNITLSLVRSVGLAHEYERIGATTLPLVNDRGHLLSYWKQTIDNDYKTTRRMYVREGFYLYPYFQRASEEDRTWVNDVPEIEPVTYSHAWLLNIRSYYPDYLK